MHQRWRVLGVVVVVGWSASTVVACGGSNDTNDEPAEATEATPISPVQQTVGAAGGTVKTSEGSGVDIPAGAVPDNVDISVTPAPNTTPPPASQPVGTPYVFGPSGIQFAKPVTVILAFDPARLPAGKAGTDIIVFTAKDGTTDYKPLRTTLRDATHVAAETTHFSVFVPTIPPPDFDPSTIEPPPTADAGCTPVLCGAYGPGACGPHSNNCGGSLDCGSCVEADAGSDAGSPTDGGTASDAGGSDGGVCQPLTCAGNYPSSCGTFNDGCSGTINCTGGCDGGTGPDGGATDAGDGGTGPDGGATDAGGGSDGGATDAGDGSDGGVTDAGDGSDGGTTDAGGGPDGGATDAGGGSDGGACMSCPGAYCGDFDTGCGVVFCGGGCTSDGGPVDASSD